MHTGRRPTLSSDNMQLLQRVWSLPLKATTINKAVVALNYDVKYVANLLLHTINTVIAPGTV